MTGGTEARIAAHYGTRGVHARILAELRARGHDPDALRPEDLKPVESMHVGGWQATEEVLALLGVPRGARVLDIGCGVGGTARTLAVQHGARVTGIDLTPELVGAAEDLSRRAGVEGVTFVQGSAASLPFEDASFDLATMLHVGMNLRRQAGALPRGGAGAQARRPLRGLRHDALRPGGAAVSDAWAVDPATSFVATPEDYAAAAQAAGFSEARREERRDGAVAAVEGQRAARPGRRWRRASAT